MDGVLVGDLVEEGYDIAPLDAVYAAPFPLPQDVAARLRLTKLVRAVGIHLKADYAGGPAMCAACNSS